MSDHRDYRPPPSLATPDIAPPPGWGAIPKSGVVSSGDQTPESGGCNMQDTPAWPDFGAQKPDWDFSDGADVMPLPLLQVVIEMDTTLPYRALGVELYLTRVRMGMD